MQTNTLIARCRVPHRRDDVVVGLCPVGDFSRGVGWAGSVASILLCVVYVVSVHSGFLATPPRSHPAGRAVQPANWSVLSSNVSD